MASAISLILLPFREPFLSSTIFSSHFPIIFHTEGFHEFSTNFPLRSAPIVTCARLRSKKMLTAQTISDKWVWRSFWRMEKKRNERNKRGKRLWKISTNGNLYRYSGEMWVACVRSLAGAQSAALYLRSIGYFQRSFAFWDPASSHEWASWSASGWKDSHKGRPARRRAADFRSGDEGNLFRNWQIWTTRPPSLARSPKSERCF